MGACRTLCGQGSSADGGRIVGDIRIARMVGCDCTEVKIIGFVASVWLICV